MRDYLSDINHQLSNTNDTFDHGETASSVALKVHWEADAATEYPGYAGRSVQENLAFAGVTLASGTSNTLFNSTTFTFHFTAIQLYLD